MKKNNIDPVLVNEVKDRVLKLMNKKGSWNGSMTELSQAMTTGIRRATPTNWPKSPSFLRKVMNVITPTLRKAGVKVEFGRETDHFRKRFINLTQKS